MSKDKRWQAEGKTASWLYGLAGLAFLLIGWEWGHRAYGALVLPGLAETLATLWAMLVGGRIVPALIETAGNAAMGWCVGILAGTVLGTLAGLRTEIRLTLQPVSMILLGIPAIAWIVLALLWFGGRWAVVFTVAVATAPIVFAAATEGARSLDGDLARMARAFRAPFGAMARDVYGPHMFSHLFPAVATTLAMSWKVSVMAELLSGAGGIGDGIATARAQVDTAATMAWVLVVVVMLVVFDHLLLRPLQRSMQLWRGADGEERP
ncbi:MAG: ABC transporter permease subunit [Alphaproteobacteria bacterium]|nr:ABC transporter permease subunit [Alphaproteobacteria bacterium]